MYGVFLYGEPLYGDALVPEPPVSYGPIYVAPKPHLRAFRIIHYDHDGDALGELAPNNPEFAIYLNKVGFINYDIDLAHPMSRRRYTAPYVTDFKLDYDGVDIMGGLHVKANIGDSADHVLKVGGKDWLHYLERRIFPFVDSTGVFADFVEANVDLFTIVTDILDKVLAEPNSLSLSYDSTTCGQTTNYKIPFGDVGKIMDKLIELSGGHPGFDFDVSPSRRFTMYYPRKTRTLDLVLEHGRNIYVPDYTDSGPQGTRTTGTAVGSSARMFKIIDSSTQDVFRLLDATEDVNNVTSEDDMQPILQGDADRNSIPSLEFSVKVILENLNPFAEIEIGDIIPVRGNFVYDKINDYYRVVGMTCNPTDEGDYDVELTLDDGTISL